jgi:hypothetical protein
MGSRPAFHFATVRIGLPAFGSVLRALERKAYRRRNCSAVIMAFFNVWGLQKDLILEILSVTLYENSHVL